MNKQRELLAEAMATIKQVEEAQIRDGKLSPDAAHQLWTAWSALWRLDDALRDAELAQELEARRRAGEEDLLVKEWEFAFFLAQPHLRRYQGR